MKKGLILLLVLFIGGFLAPRDANVLSLYEITSPSELGFESGAEEDLFIVGTGYDFINDISSEDYGLAAFYLSPVLSVPIPPPNRLA